MSAVAGRSAHVAILLPDLGAGGAERVCIHLANELVARGLAVDMTLLRTGGALRPLLDPRVRVFDLQARRIRHACAPLVRYLRREHPASLIACMWPLPVLALVARRLARTGTRVVAAEHTAWSVADAGGGRARRWARSATMRLAYPSAEGVVAVSDGAADDLARISGLPRDRVHAIHNPIAGARRSMRSAPLPASCRSWAEGVHRKLLAVGTLKAVKDYATLLRAFAILRRDVDARLLVLGEGEQRVALEALACELGIADQVSLPGFVADTRPFYRRADLHVLSSRVEGLPTVIVEALEQGVPVVSTDCRSGPREILRDGRFGSLVPVADPAALALAMRAALEAPVDAAALRARAADFAVGKAADAYLDLLLPGWRGHETAAAPAGECRR